MEQGGDEVELLAPGLSHHAVGQGGPGDRGEIVTVQPVQVGSVQSQRGRKIDKSVSLRSGRCTPRRGP